MHLEPTNAEDDEGDHDNEYDHNDDGLSVYGHGEQSYDNDLEVIP